MKRPFPRHAASQAGFTLLELLVAMALVLVILVGVQRYIAGVTLDHEGISARRDQATQMRIALSNMQRDVAQAGYFPYAGQLESNLPLGVVYKDEQLIVRSYQPKGSAADCNGLNNQYEENAGATNQTLIKQGWAYVENNYSIIDDTLKCDGNGSKDGYGAQPILNNVEQMSVTQPNGANNRFFSVCLLTSEATPSVGSTPTTTKCDGKTPVSVTTTDRVYYKIQADMPVYAPSFKAGQP